MGTENIEQNALITNSAECHQLQHLNGGSSATITADLAETPFIPIEIGENVIDGARQIAEALRPAWNSENIKFKLFTDGITNKLVGCFYTPESESTSNRSNGPSSSSSSSSSSCTNEVILVRVYGNKTDLLIDRKAELNNIQLLQRFGFAPRLYGVFKNGLAYEYVPGCTLTPESVVSPNVWPLVATHMARMHRLNVQAPNAQRSAAAAVVVPMIVSKTLRFLDLVPEQFTDPVKHKRVCNQFLPVQRLRDEFSQLYERLRALNSPLVFSHNDLLLGNVIYTEELNRVTFIDFEYAEHNNQAFDIGNHFTEFAGIDEIDYARYPTKEFQLEWLRCYLQAYHDTDTVTDAELARLYGQVNAFALASHFFWAVWALIQAEHSSIDFDFINFAEIRYNEYWARKEEFLALVATQSDDEIA